MNKNLDWNQIKKSVEQQKKVLAHQTTNSAKIDNKVWFSMRSIFNGHTF